MLRGPFSLLCMEPKVLAFLIKRQATAHFLEHQSKASSIFMQQIDLNTLKSVAAMNFGLHLLTGKGK